MDLAAGTITIDHTVHGAGGIVVTADLTKTNKARALAIDASACDLLRSLMDQLVHEAREMGLGIGADAYVFGPPGPHTRPMLPERMTR